MNEKSPSELTLELAHVLAGERAHTLPSILLIADIERRQTFVEEGFSTIWDYLRRVHGQSDTMIHYRVSCAPSGESIPSGNRIPARRSSLHDHARRIDEGDERVELRCAACRSARQVQARCGEDRRSRKAEACSEGRDAIGRVYFPGKVRTAVHFPGKVRTTGRRVRAPR